MWASCAKFHVFWGGCSGSVWGPLVRAAAVGEEVVAQAMRDIVAKCLVKDPSKRPSAAHLLEHKFFKTAHEPGYLVKHLLAGLPPVTERVKLMRAGKAGSASENIHMAAQSQVSRWWLEHLSFTSSGST